MTRETGVPSTADFPPEWSEPASEEQRAKWRSVTIGDRAPGQKKTDPNYIRPMVKPKWEGQPVKEKRGQFEVPLVHAHSPSQPITNKQYDNNRAGYDKARDRLRKDPAVFKN